MPPLNKIIEWIKVKPILPRANKGKLPTDKQLAFLIGRSIKKNGIKAKPLFNKTQEEILKEYKVKIKDALLK